MHINFDKHPDNSVLNCLATHCQTALLEAYGEPTTTELGAFIRNKAGQLVGGIYGSISGSWLYIDVLWLHESQRGQGYGVQLMQCLEQAAVARGIHRAFLGTATYQAPAFYHQLGYATIAQWHFPQHGSEQFIMAREPLTAYELSPCPFVIADPAPEADVNDLERALSQYNEQHTGVQVTSLVGVVSARAEDESVVGGVAGWRMGERLLPRYLVAEHAEQAVALLGRLEAEAGDWTLAMSRAEDPASAAHFVAAGYTSAVAIEDFPMGRTTYLMVKARC